MRWWVCTKFIMIITLWCIYKRCTQTYTVLWVHDISIKLEGKKKFQACSVLPCVWFEAETQSIPAERSCSFHWRLRAQTWRCLCPLHRLGLFLLGLWHTLPFSGVWKEASYNSVCKVCRKFHRRGPRGDHFLLVVRGESPASGIPVTTSGIVCFPQTDLTPNAMVSETGPCLLLRPPIPRTAHLSSSDHPCRRQDFTGLLNSVSHSIWIWSRINLGKQV